MSATEGSVLVRYHGHRRRRRDVGGVVAGAGVPADQQRLDEEPERDGPFNGGGDPVAGVPDPDDLLAPALEG